MSDYPDPEEEFELMYAEDLEVLRETEERDPNVLQKKILPARRSLDFSSPLIKASNQHINGDDPTNGLTTSQISLTHSLQPLEEVLTPITIPNDTNKRTSEYLFGDIGDIDFDNIELPSKRQKTEEENDLDLINKIIESRKLKQILSEPLNQPNVDSQSIYQVKDNISIDIPRWAFLPLTKSEGDRVYVRLESEYSWDISLDRAASQPSIHSMYSSTWEEARKILETKQQEQVNESQEFPPNVEAAVNGTSLWVDKYRPQSYLDLLSEEPVNRALLHWLHLWDKVVFKKEVKVKEPQQRNAFSKRAGQFQLTNKWKGKKDTEPEVDADGRPHHKVALICGPPGVGKTTLAHLLASLAGYRPMELNASDERTTDAFRTALQSATQMKSVLDTDKRPNCLILDEIDGAPLPTVELLVKWCTASTESGKKNAKSHPLRRPVIAICNDLYANSLRPLRPVSLVLSVDGVSISRLSARLCHVAENEGLQLAPHIASVLATRAQGDVRAAIQVLTFIKAKCKTQLTMEDVENAAIGAKDCSKSLMQTLSAVFKLNDNDTNNNLLKTIQAAGEYDRIVDGIFENYITSRIDARLLIACETLSWLRLYDTIISWTYRHQNYSLYGALPLCIARCHAMLAKRVPQRIKFPMQALEMHRRKSELDSVLWSVWRGSVPSVAATRNTLSLDILPMLPHLLSPTLRSANIQLCTENERKALRTCAGAMCEYGLQYVQQRTPDGLYAFVLEPDIYKLAVFDNAERFRPPPTIRQAIAREQQLEAIRRNEGMANAAEQNKTESSKSRVTNNKTNVEKEVKETSLPNHLQRLKPKEIAKKTPQVHKDFFGRIVPIAQVQRTDAIPDVISSSSVFYHYREGYNNAVRRNVRIRDML